MTREEAISEWTFRSNHIKKWLDEYGEEPSIRHYVELIDMAIEAIKNEPILCEDCRHRNTWDNPRLDPQYYRCGKGVKFRDYGYVREDDYCPLGERREE